MSRYKTALKRFADMDWPPGFDTDDRARYAAQVLKSATVECGACLGDATCEYCHGDGFVPSERLD